MAHFQGELRKSGEFREIHKEIRAIRFWKFSNNEKTMPLQRNLGDVGWNL